MTFVPLQEIEPSGDLKLSGAVNLGQRLLRRPLAVFGLAVIVLMTGMAIAAPIIAPYDPAEQLFEGLTLEGAPLPPNAQFLLGTDLLGRDLFSRLLYGARTSLIIGIVANGAAVAIGGIVIFFLIFGGIKGAIFTLIALGLAYRTASGAVSNS